jgi:serine protease
MAMIPRLLLFPLAFTMAANAWAATPSQAPLQVQVAAETDQIIVKLHHNAAHRSVMMSETSQVQEAIDSVGMGIQATYERAIGGDAHVVQLPGKMTLQEARDYATILRADPDVEDAEPDQLMFPTLDAIPNDPQYPIQWHYSSPTLNAGAANLPAAWGEISSTNSVVVAVIDTGVVDHPDLTPQLIGGSAAHSGYDFVNVASRGNDGDGRDNDPSDPGDWVTSTESSSSTFSGCAARNSYWHGTHVAGTIGASSNNALGVAGIGRNVKILNARALGKCGGYLSDIADAIRWSAGESINGMVNPTPAKIINLSLGGSGSCGSTYQDAINAATTLGTTVVVAAGNNAADISTHRPANCNNVIAVAALAQNGSKASFSNTGSLVDIAAPGVAILSTGNAGLTGPTEQSTYISYQGTSMAAPHVSGVLALMLSANSHLTDGSIPAATLPALLERKLKAAARPFATATGRDCTTTSCGAGALDAYRAVMAVKTPPTADAGANQTVRAGAGVTLNGSATAGGFGSSISQYLWEQTAGTPVTLSDRTSAAPTFIAPANPETLAFRLSVTNDVGLTHSSYTNVMVTTTTATSCAPSALTAGETTNGQWAAGCAATHRGSGFNARYYTFTLPSPATVKIDLKSSQQDTYLYLLQGADADGSVIASNDDSNGTTDSQITRSLSAGTYTLETTTYYKGRDGAFTINATAVASSGDEPTCAITNIAPGATLNGQWDSTCAANQRGSGYYASQYTFTLTQAATVTIDLKSSQQDTYLYLLQSGGGLLTSNDDSNGTTNSQIKRTLSAGTYRLEASTYYRGRTGAFTINLH